MRNNILFNLITGVFVVASGLISVPAHAQNNQSDITGNNVFNNSVPANIQSEILNNTVAPNNQIDTSETNVFNSNLPGSFAGNKINQETVVQAEKLYQKLRDAYRSCNTGEDCLEFNNLLQESNIFLSNLNQQVEVFENSQSNRTW